MEEQPPATVSVATGALGPVLQKLTARLRDERHRHMGARTRGYMESIISKLASMHSLLLRIWEREDLGAECKEWMAEARALSYEMEDDIDDFMLASDGGKGGLLSIHLQDYNRGTSRLEALSRWCREEWKSTMTAPREAISNKRSLPSPADPRARFLHKDVSELVGMDRPFSELQHLLRSGDHEMVCIHGFAGTGKTTLADMVYQKIGNEFECRAFVSLSKSPDTLGVLEAIFTQVTEGVHSVERTRTEATPEENRSHDIFSFLSDKRYLVIVDDIWLWQSWEVIRRALPKGNRLCRIIATTRVHAIAEKCCLTEEGATIYRHSGIDAPAASRLSSIVLEQTGEFLCWVVGAEHKIANMCGGMTLAVRCLSSAAAARIYSWHLGGDEHMLRMLWHGLLCGLLCDDPKLRPMVESLRLGYDDLPVDVKTCLLYCSIFPTGYKIERQGLVRKWITHGFFPHGPEQHMKAAAEACLDELVSRGLLQEETASSAGDKTSSYCSVHPMMRAFLLWRSKEADFATCLELPPNDCPPPRYGCPLFFGFDAGPDAFLNNIWPYILDESYCRGLRSIVLFGYSSGGGGSSSRMYTYDGCLFPWKKFKCVRVLSIENNRVPLCDTDVVAICSQMTRLRYLGLKGTLISILPPEIRRLQRLEILDVSDTGVRELPKEIGKLHRLKTLNITSIVRELPWWLSSSSISVLVGGKEVKIPRGTWSLPVKQGDNLSILLYVPVKHVKIPPLIHDRDLPVAGLKDGNRYIRVPEWIKQHFTGVPSLDIRLCKLEDDHLEFLRTMPNLQLLILRLLYLPSKPRVVAGRGFSRLESFCLDCRSGHMRVPGWVKQHFANVSSLDIRLCQLGDDDLDFLRNKMPNLQLLTLRLEVLPTRKPIFITCEGFLMLKSFCLDCRLPLVIFQQGAMPKLEHLEFKFYTSRALTSEDPPMGIRHLLRLKRVVFQSSPRYKSNAPGISSVISKVREEAKEHPKKITISINGQNEEVIQEKKEATATTSASDKISEENIATPASGGAGAGGSSGASMIETSLPIPYDNGSDDEKGNIIPVKSYYPFGITE